MTGGALALRQVRYESRAFWRNPAAAFFTFAFPLMFLAIFLLVFGGGEIEVEGGTASSATFTIPAIVAFSVVNACYTNVAMTVALARDQGLLKRVRGTPLPPWAFLAGKVAHAVVITLLLVAVVTTVGALFYDVDVPSNTLPAFVVTLVIGAAAFAALGLAVAGFIPNADAAPAVVNATILPLLFISDVFIPLDDAPVWVGAVAWIFPVRHFAEALHTSFNPFETGTGFTPLSLVVLALWGAGGVAVAARFFTWEPRR